MADPAGTGKPDILKATNELKKQVEEFNAATLKTTSTEEKNVLPTVQDIASEKFTTGNITPQKIAPEKEKPSVEKIAPEKIIPEKITPEKITPEKITPEKITPEKITPELIAPEKLEPEKFVLANSDTLHPSNMKLT